MVNIVAGKDGTVILTSDVLGVLIGYFGAGGGWCDQGAYFDIARGILF